MVALRPAVEDDAEIIAAIYVDSWNQGFGHLLGERRHTWQRTDRWRADLAATTTTWTVAELDGRVVGFAVTGPSRDPIVADLGELDTIAVDPSYWRRGVGRALMGDAVDQLGRRWDRAILWTPANYPRGHRFYAAMGWRPLQKTRASGTEVAFGLRLDGSHR